MAQIRHFVDPEAVRTELKNAAVRFFLDQRQRERIAIKRDRLVISMGRTLDCDIRTAGKLWTVEFCNHDVDLSLPLAAVKDAPAVCARPFLPFPRQSRRPQNRRGQS